MLLKLRRVLLLSGIGLITIGAIAPIISSCSKKTKVDITQEPIYDAAVVQSLFDQFIENYEIVATSNGHGDDVESEIARFEAEYEAYENEKADLPDADKYALCAKWVKDKAALYDIVLVEWTNIGKNREAMMESTLIQNKYSEEAVYAIAAQNDFIDQGIDGNMSFNDYVANVEGYDEHDSSATLFPRSHAYTLHSTSREFSREFNAVAAKANLLSQTIDSYLKLNDEKNIFTYLSTATETSPFETDGFLKYDSSGHALDFSKTTTQIVGEDGNYLNASGSAYRLLTKDAAKDLFEYSYLNLDEGINARTVKPFDGTTIFDGDTYEVGIALHVKSFDSSLDDSEQLLSYENYTTMMSTFEYNVVVTNTKNKFPLIDPNSNSSTGERYEKDDTDETHKINYFSLVGSKTQEDSIPADVTVEHGADFLTDILGYNDAQVETIVNAFGVVFADIKKDERGADGRPTDAAKLDEDMVKPFYLLASDGEKKNGLVSFTDKYGTNGNLASTKGSWLFPEDASAAVHLQVKFIQAFVSNFGNEYFKSNNVDVNSLTIAEANNFLNFVLGAGVLQIAVKIEDTGYDQENGGSLAELTTSFVQLGVYLAKPDADEENKYEVVAPLAAQNNDSHYGAIKFTSTTSHDSFKQYVKNNENYNTLYFPLFMTAQQAKNNGYCANLLIPENLTKHEKIMKFISVDNVQNFVGHVSELVTLNKVYYALNISMVILYGIKAIVDAFTLAASWAVPMLMIQAAIQLAGDILSIVFTSLEIYNTGKTLDRLEPMLDIFKKYLGRSRSSTDGYAKIKAAYDAYMTQLKVFKDITKTPLARVNAAASVAEPGGLYDVFMKLLTTNLFDFVNESLKEAMKIEPDFDSDGFNWNMFQGVNELAPFLVAIIYRIISTIILVLFIRVAGVLFRAAANALATGAWDSITKILASNTGISFYHGLSDISKFQNISYKIGDIFFKTADDLAKFNKALTITKPFMELSGVASIILGIMDILFTVGYSIAISVISDDVNDVVGDFIY